MGCQRTALQSKQQLLQHVALHLWRITLTSVLPVEAPHCFVLPIVLPRLCKLDPKVEKVLLDNNVPAMVTLAMPPQRTQAILMRVEDGLWMAGVAGNEGTYPGRSEQDVMRFAQEVRAAAATSLPVGTEHKRGRWEC
jgi:hypothetical protein